MIRRCFPLVLAALALLVASPRPRAAPGPAPRVPELVVIVHLDNPAQVSPALLEDIFLRRQTQWPDGERIIPLNAPPDAEHRQLFDRAVLRMSPDEVARYWLDQRIRGQGAAPREVGEALLTIKLITKLKMAVGYVPDDVELHGVRIVARIRDGKLISP